MQVGTIETSKLRGVTDKGFGYGKELLGVLIGNARLESEGEAQQERAAAELKALRAQIRAQREDVKARVSEERQRAARRAKEAGKERADGHR